MFFLTVSKVAYILDPALPSILTPKEDDSDAIKVEHHKREDDEVLCHGHILDTLSDRVYDVYKSLKIAKEIWHELKYKYNIKKQGADKFLISKYFDYIFNDDFSLLFKFWYPSLKILV